MYSTIIVCCTFLLLIEMYFTVKALILMALKAYDRHFTESLLFPEHSTKHSDIQVSALLPTKSRTAPSAPAYPTDLQLQKSYLRSN